MAWKMTGTYMESCNCEAACPCVFLSSPSQGECTALVGWHIDKGSDDGTSLDGLNVVLAVHSPGSMHLTKWNVAVYVDAKATDAQEKALVKIFGGQAGGHPAALAACVGKIVGVKKVPITFTQEGKTAQLVMPQIADVTIEAIPGAGGADIQISGHPLCIAPGFPVTAARSKSMTYKDHGWSWTLSQRNGFFSPFAYQN